MSNDYSDYWDWYDNGPGSERWKREMAKEMSRIKKSPIRIEGFPWYQPFDEKKKEEFLKDEDVLI